jgi:hypothetical protein
VTAEDLNKAAAHCPSCGAEYRTGFDTCADDGAQLVPGPAPPEPPEQPEPVNASVAQAPHGWAGVGSFLRDDEARLLAGRLNAEGIPARVFPDDFPSSYGTAVGALLVQGIDVLVPEERVLEARELMERIAGDG